MTQDDAFLQAILETPDDDGPRLIYADWLEEQGDPRGAFIRIQCQLARMPEDEPRRGALEVEEAPLLAKMRKQLYADKPLAWARIPAWARKAGLQARSPQGPCEFERGFLARLHTSATPFLKGIEALLHKIPVQHVRLSGARRLIGAVADCSHLGQLRSLELPWQKLGNEGLAVLLASPHLCRLRALDLSFNNLHVAGVKALAEASWLSQLRNLVLHYNRVYDAGVEVIASSATLARLESLTLSHGQIGARGTRALAESRELRQLRALDLSHNRIGDAGAEMLASAEELSALTTLRLSNAQIRSAGVRALLTTPGLPRLAQLDLSGNEMEADVWRIAPASHLHGRFHLTMSNLGPKDEVSLAASPLLAACIGLHLTGRWLTDHDAAALADAPEAAGLRELSATVLDVPGSLGMGEAGMRAIGHSPHLAQVRRLRLCGGAPKDPALPILAALLDSPMARRLTHLDLELFSLSDDVLDLLAESNSLDGLQQLHARDPDGSIDSLVAVQERFGPRLFLHN